MRDFNDRASEIVNMQLSEISYYRLWSREH